ncbi:MAG: leucine-rich repeat domain-containing protein [Treponema sp.]|jgi:hypothetical protein|nr:leucine-rich repeat domain-containing protein [Treponema sp.]
MKRFISLYYNELVTPPPDRFSKQYRPLGGVFLLLIISLSAAFLSGCIGPLGHQDGNLRITFPGAGRAAAGELLSYRIAFHGSGGEAFERALAPGVTSLSVTVAPGRWAIHADAFTLAGTLYGSGDGEAVVVSGGNNSLTILMRRVSASPGAGSSPAFPLTISLSGSISGWNDVVALISAAGGNDKYLALDLSGCTITSIPNTMFDPDSAISTGKDKIVSLVLPATATDIKAGTYSNPTFKNFSALKSVSGAGVNGTTGVGGYAFYNCAALTAVNFPVATTIGAFAFGSCTALTSISLPASLTTIDNFAFSYCTTLTSISLPASLTTIADSSFVGCVNLTNIQVDPSNSAYKNSVDGKMLLNAGSTTLIAYPSASGNITVPTGIAAIGNYAFANCATLTSVSLPDATSIGSSAFTNCASLSVADFPQVTSIGPDVFSGTRGTSLTITLGASTAPTLGNSIFGGITMSKSVTVKVPSSATGYGTVPFNNSDTTSNNWGNAFRGKGWDGTNYLGSLANSNITLTITYLP